jgi:SAM-dependent methyltransferase
MLRYYSWAVAEKTLSVVPFGGRLYRAASLIANSNGRSRRRLSGSDTAYELVRKACEMTPPGGTILDVGTGWHHHDPVLLYLTGGDYKVYLFDVEDKARLEYLQVYFLYLLDNLDELEREIGIDKVLAREKLLHLLTLKSRKEVYRACNFELRISMETHKTFLPDASVDFMVSNCVLTHIPPTIVEPELRALGRMLKPSGAMYMMVGHDDHWAFHDHSANRFNYYRYSDKVYSRLFDTKFEYQNRMVKSEWLPVFARAGLEVAHYYPRITDQTRRDIEALPHIDERFARYSLDELATVHSYFLLTHAKALRLAA